jgi:hypothetical protein|tara:strand:- start:197 stop:514 length:318 start_codon:yes stop_codon:yes gene_type:complete
MSTRKRAMALDIGTSSTADLIANPEVLGWVKTAVLRILRQCPRTDDEIIREYNARVPHPYFPQVTPQRIRTARAQLVRDGLVVEAPMLGHSDLGNPAAIWEPRDA